MTGAGRLTRRLLAAAGLVLLCLLLVLAGAGLWLRGRMVASLPKLDGTVPVKGLSSPVKISRDALGTATLEGSSRLDVARAMGWIHAQDRFFQMDVLRRRGAGELAEIFGADALPLDREARLHGFRKIAHEVLLRDDPARRAIVEAYSEGVNAGLAALDAKPWEYVILRTQPRPWVPEDCVLINFAMTLDLQDSTGRFVRVLASIRDELGPASLAFFAPLNTPGDAALDASLAAEAAIPPPAEVDLRRQDAPAAPTVSDPTSWVDRGSPGSNSFAVAGSLAAGGAALVANDMHLHLGSPNIWYRVCLRWPGHEETGVSLAGTPMLVAGSTGKIAWGFTVSNAGTGDILVVDPSISPDLYHGPHNGDLVPYEVRKEVVAVKGTAPVSMEFKWTVWGPVVAEAAHGRQLVYHWTADDPSATNLSLLDLEDASGVDDAVAVAHRVGIPAQNFIVADAGGRIAWTVAGFIPKRMGYDGRLPVTWLFGDRRWDGYVAPADVPNLVSPADGLLWTANNRTLGGKSLNILGDSGYDIPARAHQIRDDLAALARAGRPIGPKDLLGVQLDDRALLMGKWHDLLVQTLSPGAVSQGVGREAVLEAAQAWEGRALASSASYRVVHDFRLAVAHRVFDPIFQPCVDRDPDFTWSRLNYEAPLEALVKARPAHLLDPAFRTWDSLLLAAVDDVAAADAKKGLDPRKATWGQRNTAQIGHPFTHILPRWASGWLSMPADELPGDSNMPRVQDPSFGASERFVVSPGHESEGLFHMPGGQNSNPFSPFFRAGHEAWVHGEPTAFLPGPASHTLTLGPGSPDK